MSSWSFLVLLASVLLRQGTTFTCGHLCLGAVLAAAVSLNKVGAITLKVVGGEISLVHVETAQSQQQAVTHSLKVKGEEQNCVNDSLMLAQSGIFTAFEKL